MDRNVKALAVVCVGPLVLLMGTVRMAAGISAGIDMSLHVVRRLLGAEAAADTATYMEYDWRE